VYQLEETEVFGRWLFDLRDVRAKARMANAIE
jgi:putative component of toxin-antitoxin plasmid stabilization module